MKLHIKDKDYELSTSLRVVYALKDIAGATSLQGAINSISKLDMDGQLELLYAAYKAANPDGIDKKAFIDDIIDNYGIFAMTNAINQLTDGLLYSGLSPEEIASKKSAVERKIATATATGVPSSAEDLN